MPLPGSGVVFEVSLDDVTYFEPDGLKEASFSPSRDLGDVTYFKTADVAKRKFALLRDGTISASGHFVGEPNGQGTIRAKFDDGADIYVRIKLDPGAAVGSQGYKTVCKVASWEASPSVEDVIPISFSFEFSGLPVAV
jgi:hypothetical protein